MGGFVVIDPDDLVGQDEVLKRWPDVFTTKSLAKARRESRIGHLVGPSGRVLYPRDELARYIAQEMYKPCRPANGNTENSGSAGSAPAAPSIGTGMTRPLDERAGDLLIQRICAPLRKPSSS